MTSDHKIGLLLGLVFIFVIAFLINGLPSLKASAHGNELTYNMVNYQAEKPGLATRERQIGHSMESPEHSSAQTPLADSPLISGGDRQPEVRFQMTLPAPDPAVSRSVADVMRENRSSTAERKKRSAQSGTRFYVVQSGDNLGTISAKVYGRVLGNKLATVNALFNANKTVLSSRDAVPAGAKLVIPLMTGTTKQVSTSNTVSGKITNRSGGKAKRRTAASAIHTVRDGDSLWEIADERLGDGNRFKEILNLNQKVLQGSVNVVPGMHLKLPAQ